MQIYSLVEQDVGKTKDISPPELFERRASDSFRAQAWVIDFVTARMGDELHRLNPERIERIPSKFILVSNSNPEAKPPSP